MDGAPVPFIGFDPTDHPGRLPAAVEEGGAGAANGGGIAFNPIRNISIAFGFQWNSEHPQWTDITTVGAQA